MPSRTTWPPLLYEIAKLMAFDRINNDVEMISRGAVANMRAVVALVFREAALRFGESPYSYVWTLVEPAILIALVLLVRYYVRDANPAFGDNSTIFLLTGFMTFRMSRNTIHKAGRSLSGNQTLFSSGLVTVLDTVVARTIVEFSIWLIVLTVFFVAVSRILQETIITNFQGFSLTLLLIFYFCFAMALLNATMGALTPIWTHAWKLMNVPLMILSGVFYVPAMMPPPMLEIIKWNPFLHCIEGIRASSYLDFITIYDPVYLMTVSTVVLVFSLIMEALFRNRIIKSKFKDDDEEELI